MAGTGLWNIWSSSNNISTLRYLKGEKMEKKNPLNHFKTVLGEYCAINQFMELSKRCFMCEHGRDLREKESFIKLANQYKLTLTDYDSEKMAAEICRSYIVHVHLCFETYLKEVYDIIKKYGVNKLKERNQEESYLKCLVNNICSDGLPDNIKKLYDLCEYYRLVRNSAVHDLHKIETYEKQFQKLSTYNFKVDTKFEKLLAPNKYTEISFDDFVMFARSSLEIASYLFRHISYDYEKIFAEIPEKKVKKWKNYSDDRLKKTIPSYIETMCGGKNLTDEQLFSIIEYIRAR